MIEHLLFKRIHMRTVTLPVPAIALNRRIWLVLLATGLMIHAAWAQGGRRGENRNDGGTRISRETLPGGHSSNGTGRDISVRGTDKPRPERPVFQDPHINRNSGRDGTRQEPSRDIRRDHPSVTRPVNNRPETTRPVTETNRPQTYSRPGNGVANRPDFRPSGNSRPVLGSVERPRYRPVYSYNYRPHYDRYNPSWRFGWLPRRHSYYYSLPSTYFSISFGGIGYRYWDGVFYRPYNNMFMVVAPPAGIFINVMPTGYYRFMLRDRYYYYYNGTYYDYRDSKYFVVSPPVGAVVESLPAGYETVVIDGETFYTADGAQYKPVIKENGEIWYEVIKANN